MNFKEKYWVILTNLFKKIPDDTYSEEETATNVFSSINTFYNSVIEYTNNLDSEKSTLKIIDDSPEIQDYMVAEKLNYLFQLCEDLISDVYNHIYLKNLVGYLKNYLCGTTVSIPLTYWLQESILNYYNELANRKDFPAIVLYAFYQMVFVLLYKKFQGKNLPEDLLFNENLNKYHLSLPYEDQVTCSYFVFRYLYTPEERTNKYTNEHIYDFGCHLSQAQYSNSSVNSAIEKQQKSLIKNLLGEQMKNPIQYTTMIGIINKVDRKTEFELYKEFDPSTAKLKCSRANVFFDIIRNRIREEISGETENSKKNVGKINDCSEEESTFIEKSHAEQMLIQCLNHITDKQKNGCNLAQMELDDLENYIVNKIIDGLNSNGDKWNSLKNFIKRIKKLGIHINESDKLTNIDNLKLYYLYKTIKNGRFARLSGSESKGFGFDIIKLIMSVDADNYVYDDNPHKTTNGFYSTLLLSEIKKEVDFADVIRLTGYYVKTMSYLHDTINLIKFKFHDGNSQKELLDKILENSTCSSVAQI